MSKQISIVVLLLLITVFAASCGKDLSRSKAEDVIKANSAPLTINFQSLIGKPDLFSLNNVDGTRIQKLLNEGYLTQWQKPAPGVTSMGLPTFDIGPSTAYQFTDKSAPYMTADLDTAWNIKTVDIRVADVSQVTINGITKPAQSMGKTVCEVDYTVHYKPNPLGEILLDKQSLIRQRSAQFILYDDGWKMVL